MYKTQINYGIKMKFYFIISNIGDQLRPEQAYHQAKYLQKLKIVNIWSDDRPIQAESEQANHEAKYLQNLKM